MIDTIVLALPKGMYTINDCDKFTPSARLILGNPQESGSRGFITCKQNPTKSDYETGIYKPRLTLTNRINTTGRYEATLKIELSLPKLLFGNNFDELDDVDFDKLVTVLVLRLRSMGILVRDEWLQHAPVSTIHYSKNILLANGQTSSYLISKIKQANVKLSLDTNQTDYRNEGHSFKYHTNCYEIAFYDKIKDLEQFKVSPKRAMDIDSGIQIGLFDQITSVTRKTEALRFEVRLNTRAKIRSILKSLSEPDIINFGQLFKCKLSQKILTKIATDIASSRPAILDTSHANVEDFLADLRIQNPGLQPTKIMAILGYKTASDALDQRQLRQLLGMGKNNTWSRFSKTMNSVQLPKQTNPLALIFDQLADFKPTHLVDINPYLLNNDKDDTKTD